LKSSGRILFLNKHRIFVWTGTMEFLPQT